MKNAVLYANALAGEGKPGVVVPTGLDKRIAVEANVVAVLGMIVQKVHRTLDVTRLWQRVMTLFASDTWLNHRLVMRPLDSWPRRELAEIIVSWIMEASDQTIDSNESCHESLSRS